MNYNDMVEHLKDVYTFIKENGLVKPIINYSKNLVNWFKGLFTRKAHKERVKLMEQQQAQKEGFDLLRGELQAQLEEKEALMQEFMQKLAELKKEKDENKQLINTTSSKLKNVNFGNVNTAGGSFRLGDTNINKK